MCVKSIKNMQSNGYISKIYSNFNFFFKVIIVNYN